PFPAYNS
nr:fragmentin, granule protein=RNK protease 1 homolog [rats, inbred F344, large granular lymphocyte leukemia cell line RNK-16, Peptide Partial, 7 aa] [Rattus sp.]